MERGGMTQLFSTPSAQTSSNGETVVDQAAFNLNNFEVLDYPNLDRAGTNKPSAQADRHVKWAFKNGKNWWRNGDNGDNAGFPARVWYRFSYKRKVGRIEFSNRKDSRVGLSPKKFRVIASGQCRGWKTLLTVEDAGFTDVAQSKAWWIPTENRGWYFCYGIEFLSSQVGNGPNQVVVVRNIRMFKRK